MYPALVFSPRHVRPRTAGFLVRASRSPKLPPHSSSLHLLRFVLTSARHFLVESQTTLSRAILVLRGAGVQGGQVSLSGKDVHGPLHIHGSIRIS